MNFDSLSLSTNPDVCRPPDDSVDIIFQGLGPVKLFYQFKEDELHLYISRKVAVPAQFSSNVTIIQHEITNIEFLALKENYQSHGLEFLDVEIDKSLVCGDALVYGSK